jgi:hypothetical protein
VLVSQGLNSRGLVAVFGAYALSDGVFALIMALSVRGVAGFGSLLVCTNSPLQALRTSSLWRSCVSGHPDARPSHSSSTYAPGARRKKPSARRRRRVTPEGR